MKALGTVRVAVVFVDFADAPARRTPQQVFAMISPKAEQYFAAVSYGRMNLILEPSFTWRHMSKLSTAYRMDHGGSLSQRRALSQEALNLATEVDFSRTDGFVVISNPDGGAIPFGPAIVGSAGSGVSVGGKEFLNGAISGRDLNQRGALWLNHELGHALGLPDLYAGGGYNYRFVGGFSVMSLIDGHSPELFGWERWVLGWIDDAQVSCAPVGTTDVLLTPIERKDEAKIVVARTGPTTAIVAESRRAEGYDKSERVTPGVVVYLVDTSLEGTAGGLRVLPINDRDQVKDGIALQPGGVIRYGLSTVTVLSSDSTGDRVRILRRILR
jgi:M6 family metalloprotease-like protein